jgi:hypothetical protein
MEVEIIRRAALSVLLIMALSVPAVAGIRGTDWRMPKTEVEELEGKPKAEEEDRLIYEDVVGGVGTDVIYLFNHRMELYAIEYRFIIDRPFMKPALEQFDRVGSILRSNYGAPSGGAFFDEGEKRIGALAMGKAIVEEWTKDDATSVRHTLAGGNTYEHVLVYRHEGLATELEELLTKEDAEKL